MTNDNNGKLNDVINININGMTNDNGVMCDGNEEMIMIMCVEILIVMCNMKILLLLLILTD
jgi:hypothetical protein